MEGAMIKEDVLHIETQIRELRGALKSLANGEDFEKFIVTICHPGWTTPAEFTLVSGIVDSMVQQAKTMLGLKQALFTGAKAIELNQPEPPSLRALAQELMSHTLP